MVVSVKEKARQD